MAAAATQTLAEALAAQGHDIHIVTSREARPAEAETSWRTLREPVELGYARLHARARQWRWWDVNLIADLVKRYEFDVINV